MAIRIKRTLLTRNPSGASGSSFGKLRTKGVKKAKRFTKKANTPKKQRQWKHVYKSERKRGLSKARAIRAASSTLKRNPSGASGCCFLIEAYAPARHQFFYVYRRQADKGYALTTKREEAVSFAKSTASATMRKLRTSMPQAIEWARVVPA